MYDYMDLDGLIKMYSILIAEDMMEGRGEIHIELCRRLGVKYDSFAPFESMEITEIPTEEKAEKILRKAIKEIGDSNE